MWWLIGVVGCVVSAATYLTWIAARVDRLHHRAAAAYSALDAQLVRRAAAALALADAEADPERRERTRRLCGAALSAQQTAGDGREVAENQLTRVLRELGLQEQQQLAVGAPDGASAPLRDHSAAEVAVEVVTASRMVALARQVHSDLVRDALAARRRPVSRLLGLGRRHPRPSYFDIEDPVLDA